MCGVPGVLLLGISTGKAGGGGRICTLDAVWCRQQYLDFIAINQRAAQSLGFNNLQDQWIERWG